MLMLIRAAVLGLLGPSSARIRFLVAAG
jgi:hypothetical protein